MLYNRKTKVTKPVDNVWRDEEEGPRVPSDYTSSGICERCPRAGKLTHASTGEYRLGKKAFSTHAHRHKKTLPQTTTIFCVEAAGKVSSSSIASSAEFAPT